MEYLSSKLTNYILKKELIQKDDYESYQYGFQRFLEIFLSIICSVIIAFVLDMKLECILFFLLFIPLRSYGGGFHMKTYISCLLFSCITLTAILLIVKYYNVASPISFLIYLLSLLMLKLIGPVNHPNREVDSEENLVFIKKINWIFFISFLVAILFCLKNFSKYLFLEALVFLLVSVTSLLGRIIYSSSK